MLYVGKQLVAWEGYYVKYLAKKLQEIILGALVAATELKLCWRRH